MAAVCFSARENGLVNSLGAIDDEIDRRPQANVFFDQHVDWMSIDESLKQVDG